MMPPAQHAATVMKCPPNDPNCNEKVGTNKSPGVPGLQNYPSELIMLSSETLSTTEGLKVSFRLVLRNPTSEPFGRFQVVLCPATILQGRPIGPPSVFLLTVESLDPGETTFRFIENLDLPPFEGGRFHCLDDKFPASGT